MTEQPSVNPFNPGVFSDEWHMAGISSVPPETIAAELVFRRYILEEMFIEAIAGKGGSDKLEFFLKHLRERATVTDFGFNLNGDITAYLVKRFDDLIARVKAGEPPF